MMFLSSLLRYKNIAIALIILLFVISNLIFIIISIVKQNKINQLENHIELLNEEVIFTSNNLIQYKSNLLIAQTKSNYIIQIELISNNIELSSNEKYILHNIYSNFYYLMRP